MIAEGSDIGGRFTVLGVIGEGGIATVYKVRHTSLHSEHALKLLHMQKGDMARRLLVEGRIQARLRHPNVVAVTDVVDVAGATGLVMEYVEGSSLREVLEDGRGLARDDALGLFAQVLAGVASAHRADVLHRDLKPANILLAVTNRGVLAKVTDFGIAKVAVEGEDRQATRAGAILGTPGYMAPEQIEDSTRVDRRSDIFALGAILYEMLSGRCPFLRSELFATLNATTKGVYEPIGQVIEDCPLEIESAITTALKLDPEARFSTCEEFAEALFGVGYELDAGTFLAAKSAALPAHAAEPGRAKATSPTLAPSDFSRLRQTLNLIRERQGAPVSQDTFAPENESTHIVAGPPSVTTIPPVSAPPLPPQAVKPLPPRKVPSHEELLEQFPEEKKEEKGLLDLPGIAMPGSAGADANAAATRGAFMLARGVAFVARYVAGPAALLLFLGYRQAAEGQEIVDRIRVEREQAQVDLLGQMERQGSLVARLQEGGGRVDVLAPHVLAFERAASLDDRVATGRKLLVQMQREMATLPAAASQDEVLKRRLLDRDMKSLAANYDTYESRELVWDAALARREARLAESLGMATPKTGFDP